MSGNSMVELVRQARGDRPAPAPSPAPSPPAADDDSDEFPSYAKLRGPRQAAFMLELRLLADEDEALDYGLLYRVRFNRSGTITLYFPFGKVTVRGKKLRPLCEALHSHRVTWIAELSDEAAEKAARDPEATIVTEISVEIADR